MWGYGNIYSIYTGDKPNRTIQKLIFFIIH
jgi:hypothetical protein